MKIYKIAQNEYDFLEKLKMLAPSMAQAAQNEYDAWDQDENGMSDWMGSGGICQEIARAMCDVLSENGINCSEINSEMGEQHVWAIAWEFEEKTEDGYNAFHVDIDPSWYETGGGYTWKKIPDVIFSATMISISRADDEIVDYLKEL